MSATTEPKLHILAFTDGTSRSGKVIRSAARLVTAHPNSALDILCVMPATPTPEGEELSPSTPIPQALWPDLPAGLRHLATDVLSWLAAENLCTIPDEISYMEASGDFQRLNLESCQRPVRIWLTHEDANTAIVSMVEHSNPDLVMIRAAKTSILGRFLGRDLPASLAMQLPCNLLVVRHGIYPDSKFVLCSDDSDSAKRAFGVMRKIAPALRQPVDTLVNDGQDPTQLQEWLAQRNLRGEILTMPAGSEDPAHEIMLRMRPDQVLVLGASMRNYILRKFHGTVPMALIRRAPCSVLLSKELPDKTDQEAAN